MTDPRLDEISGVAPSRTQPNVLWVHNDSGDSARMFAIGADGVTRATITVTGAHAYDWEDITLAAGPDGRDWIWIADTGDNKRARPSLQLYRFPEPDAATGDQRVAAQTITVTYPRGERHDAESFFIDPVSGDGYIVTKETHLPGTIMRLPRRQLDAGVVHAEAVGKLPPNMRITAGDIRADGGAIVLRDYETAYAFARRPGESVEAALARAPMRVAAPDESEAIAFTPDGRSWLSIHEGRGAPISKIHAPHGG